MATSRQADHKEWVVTLEPGTAVGPAGAALAKAGLHIDQVLEAIGVITGSGAASLGSALRKVPGVADVASQTTIDIGPPDAPVS
jgi:hypothetical protein